MRLQFRLGESAQPLGSLPASGSPVDWGDVGLDYAPAGELSGVPQRNADLQGISIQVRCRRGDGEARITKAVPEREKRPHAFQVVPLVADRSALVVGDVNRDTVGLAETGYHRMCKLVVRSGNA